MPDPLPIDHGERLRFEREWRRNFAVCANAGSGKTTAISRRLAAIAMDPEASKQLSRTAVVTYTKKAARQIGQRARSVLVKRLGEDGGRNLNALDLLERTFFGTIHSFCLNLAQRHGHSLGMHLNPEVLDEDDTTVWTAFIESDPLDFPGVTEAQLSGFLRHRPLDSVYALAQKLSKADGQRLLQIAPASAPPSVDLVALEEIGRAKTKGAAVLKLAANQRAATAWVEAYRNGSGFIGFPEPEGTAGGVVELFRRLVAPVKQWVADTGGIMAAVLAERYRAYRRRNGLQTYADQTEMALAVLKDPVVLDKVRGEGWRIILDEAQDTDPVQFSILVEITRPPGAVPGAWPRGGAAAGGPREGHFCMVGDGQQAIYGGRADVRNFLRYVAAFQAGNGGEAISFSVTFRAPARLIEFMNDGMAGAFSAERPHSLGLPLAGGGKAPYLQVPYQALQPQPRVAAGRVSRIPLIAPVGRKLSLDEAMREESEQVAGALLAAGPAGLGVRAWGEVCVIAPRNAWLTVIAEVFRKRGFKVALQQRSNRNGSNPVYAWVAGLLAVLCHPWDSFEWTGVLREVFGIADAVLAEELRTHKRFQWEEPEVHGPSVAAALAVVRPLILKADDEGEVLARYFQALVGAAALAGKAWAVDPSGGLAAELSRLAEEAAVFGLEGGTVRQWFAQLVDGFEKGRPSGNPEPDALTLITAHSAKGLEWPVVVPMGLGRALIMKREDGFRLVERDGEGPRVFFDSASVPEALAEAQLRETWREYVRLMYVVFTRPEQHLVLPWGPDFGKKPNENSASFATLWGDTRLWEALPVLEAGGQTAPLPTSHATEAPAWEPEALVEALEPQPLPQRLLPHQLAHAAVDQTRTAQAHAGEAGASVRGDADEAVAFGLWWHETLEFFPWSEPDDTVSVYLEKAYKSAELAGYGERARADIGRWLVSAARTVLADGRWLRQAELGVFAPVQDGAWIDGVMDLVLRDPVSREVRVVDWKTNRRRQGERDEALGGRIVAEYTPQLQAYGRALTELFPGDTVTLWLYPTALGALLEVPFR